MVCVVTYKTGNILNQAAAAAAYKSQRPTMGRSLMAGAGGRDTRLDGAPSGVEGLLLMVERAQTDTY